MKESNHNLLKYIIPGLLINPFNREEVEFKTQNNMKTVKLNNGTILEVGKKYSSDIWGDSRFIEIISLTDKHFIYLDENGNEFATSLKGLNVYPHTAPQEEVKWKTFLIEFSGIKYRAILQYETLEQAQFHHPNAISITEVKLNIEEVK